MDGFERPDDLRTPIRTSPRGTVTPQGWGVAWTAIEERHRGLALARLTADGALRGPITPVAEAPIWSASVLVWTDDTWLVVQGDHDRDRVRSALLLRWFDRGGRPIHALRVAPSPGQVSAVNAFARGASAWLLWGDDAGLGPRYDPRIARVEAPRRPPAPYSDASQ